MVKIIFFFVFTFSAVSVSAHDLQYSVYDSRAVIVNFFFTDDALFSYESYEIYSPDETIPFQTGRTDSSGRISFLPDREGLWRVRSFSEDGHGLDFTLEVGKERLVKNIERPFYERYMKTITGAGIIFGIFGIFEMFFQRRKNL